jgi:hypothetical protein
VKEQLSINFVNMTDKKTLDLNICSHGTGALLLLNLSRGSSVFLII